jgi:hypothetical protein
VTLDHHHNPQNRHNPQVTDNGKDYQGAAPAIVLTKPRLFASVKPASKDSELVRRVGSGKSKTTQSTAIFYRAMTVVFVKPARGSMDSVFIAQLLEPIILESTFSNSGDQVGRSKWLHDKCKVRDLEPANASELVYTCAETSAKSKTNCRSVNVAAIYGSVNFVTTRNNGEELLEIEIQQEELDRMIAVLNIDVHNEEEVEAEVVSPALLAHTQREIEANRIRPDNAGEDMKAKQRDRKPVQLYTQFLAHVAHKHAHDAATDKGSRVREPSPEKTLLDPPKS